MEKTLFDKLVKKQLITLQSEVEVKRVAKDFGSSNFETQDFYNITDIKGTRLTGTSVINGKELKFGIEQIVAIDGMSPKRLCEAFKIKH